MGGDRSDLRAAIEGALDSCPINHAIERLAAAANIDLDSAWNAIKRAISLGTLPAQCIDDCGERIALASHWIELLAQFQLPSEPGITDQPIGAVPDFVRYTDFPEAGILWFDRRRASENRLAHVVTADNRPESSLPPTRARDVVVSCAFLGWLIAALASLQEQRRVDTSIAPKSASSPATIQPRRRGAYKAALGEWMAGVPLDVLHRMTHDAIASEFKHYCEQQLPDLLTLLPKRLRSMEPLIKRIVADRVAAVRADRANTLRPPTARKGQ